ncbi:MAG: HsdR family type I site-specific deoxyribonuclease [Cyclobacteriaceae bacterium]
MIFKTEAEFESALIHTLTNKGWEKEILKNPTEEDLMQNWADILFANNRSINRLNDVPLTKGEMQQILEQINNLKTPLRLNGFINGKTVTITRENEIDKLHFGKEISLKIYDRKEIAAGQSRYQIVQQPRFPAKSKILNDRRGDLMLLINGMPVFHIELKRSNVSVTQASYQIEKYSHEGVFSGLFALIQIFVAMSPEETRYFANPGPEGKFNKDFYFQWADFYNEPINKWDEVASNLLNIPMAHQLIGFYTVADNSDGVLKVMRSYQIKAAQRISDKVSKTDWKLKNLLGGYIWHTTGSGKTMTSFKSAQLIANSKDADKVVFLMDRIELGTQSLKEYRGFASENEDIQATENTGVLITKLKSDDPANTLIVTSIQKMSNINDEEGGLNEEDIKRISGKRLVFIVDEAHRSTFGDMLITIKNTFEGAIFFGFTGTPIHDENKKKDNTTSTVFGDELHRYSIADGIRDRNVLGFDPYRLATYKDRELKREVALSKAQANDEAEAMANAAKKAIYDQYMNLPMAGHYDASGTYVRGIEDYISRAQYERDAHYNAVVKDILDNWNQFSRSGQFHAIFATSSIVEAIDYYRRIKAINTSFKITALFDPNIDNNEGFAYKEEGLVEIIEDYNERYDQSFTLATHPLFKKDIANRLAHKANYIRVANTPELQLDLLIVVDQMLTGFDSRWINTLYLDKLMEYENIIQAFSRTNRLFGPDKPHGTIRYYRKPHTMERNINDAIKLYSGDKPLGLFVQHLDANLRAMNQTFEEITRLFETARVVGFAKLPNDLSERGRFASLFKNLNDVLEAAKVQGFRWKQLTYFENDPEIPTTTLQFDESTYQILALRYKELFSSGGGNGVAVDVPFEIDSYLTEIDTGKIDADYMNSRFEKFLKSRDDQDKEAIQHTLDELHKSFASLTQEEQKYADIFLHDVQSGAVQLEADKTFRDYVTQYLFNAKNDQIFRIAQVLALDESKLRNMMELGLTESNINEYARFDDLKSTIDKAKAKEYFEEKEGSSFPQYKVNIKAHNLLQEFIIKGGFEL